MSRNDNLTSCDRTDRPQAGATALSRPGPRTRRPALSIIAGVCAVGAVGPIGAPAALAGRAPVTCPAVAVRSISSSTVIERARVAHPGPTLELWDAHASKPGQRPRTGWVDIIALGPVAGSMDSSTVRIDRACTSKGVSVTVTMTRSAHYAGAALQDVVWRPRIEVLARPRVPEASFRVTWRMRLTNGTELARARTPTYPAQRYPATVAGIIHRHGMRARH